MPSGNFRQSLEGFYFWDTDGSGANPIAAYQCVSLAEGGEITAANAAGVPGDFGDIVVRTPVGTLGGITVATRRIVGVTAGSQFSGQLVQVVTDGVAYVMANAAIAAASSPLLHAVVNSTRTSAQTPFTNNFDMLLPVDPRLSLTYQLAMADDPAITPQSGSANVQYFPLGFALQQATAQYDLVPVELFTKTIYA